MAALTAAALLAAAGPAEPPEQAGDVLCVVLSSRV